MPLSVGAFFALRKENSFACQAEEMENRLGETLPHVHLLDVEPRFRTRENVRDWEMLLVHTVIERVFPHCPNDSYDPFSSTEGNGVVPVATRVHNFQLWQCTALFASDLGALGLGGHLGKLRGRDGTPDYDNLVELMREFLDFLKELGLSEGFAIESGQESSDDLIEFITDVDRDNLFINFDPANMILYGSGDPVEALRKLIDYVRSIHMKDATWADKAIRGKDWGGFAKLGDGDVNWTEFFQVLTENNWDGRLTVEHERMDGSANTDAHWQDIKDAIAFTQARV